MPHWKNAFDPLASCYLAILAHLDKGKKVTHGIPVSHGLVVVAKFWCWLPCGAAIINQIDWRARLNGKLLCCAKACIGFNYFQLTVTCIQFEFDVSKSGKANALKEFSSRFCGFWQPLAGVITAKPTVYRKTSDYTFGIIEHHFVLVINI